MCIVECLTVPSAYSRDSVYCVAVVLLARSMMSSMAWSMRRMCPPSSLLPAAVRGCSSSCVTRAALTSSATLLASFRAASAVVATDATVAITASALHLARRHSSSQQSRHPHHHRPRQHRREHDVHRQACNMTSAHVHKSAHWPVRDKQTTHQERLRRASPSPPHRSHGHTHTKQRETGTRTHATPSHGRMPLIREDPSSPLVGIAEAAAVHDDSFLGKANEGGQHEHQQQQRMEGGTGTASAMQSGWDYEHQIDLATGKTPLDVLYDTHLARIRAVLEQPLPALPVDGHINPDFFVGFGYYNYRLRDEYRAVLARALGVPVRAVQLSVAWSGRFSIVHFHRVRYVCGVLLRRDVLQGPLPTASTSAHSVSSHADAAETHERGADEKAAAAPTSAPDEDVDKDTLSESTPLPSSVQKRVTKLIGSINAKKDDSLLQMHMTQASAPIPEVEFSLHTREHRLLIRLHTWLQDHLLRTSSVVIVYGGGRLLLARPTHWCAAARAAVVERDSAAAAAAADDKTKQHEAHAEPAPSSSSQTSTQSTAAASSATRLWESALRHDVGETAHQRRVVERSWLKTFHTRRIVPRVLSLYEVAYALADAVRRGDLPEVHLPHTHALQPCGPLHANGRKCDDSTQPKSTAHANTKHGTHAAECGVHGDVTACSYDAQVKSSAPCHDAKRCGQDCAHETNEYDSTGVSGSHSARAREESSPAVSRGRLLLPRSVAGLIDTNESAHAGTTPLPTTTSSTASLPLPRWYTMPIFTALTAAQQDAAVEWLSLVHRALLFMERRTATPGSPSVSGVEASDQWVPPGTRPGDGLPVFFVHGGLAGGTDQMNYLQHNKQAIDVVLLHPNDVTIKKTIASCVRHGRARLRLYEEAASYCSTE